MTISNKHTPSRWLKIHTKIRQVRGHREREPFDRQGGPSRFVFYFSSENDAALEDCPLCGGQRVHLRYHSLSPHKPGVNFLRSVSEFLSFRDDPEFHSPDAQMDHPDRYCSCPVPPTSDTVSCPGGSMFFGGVNSCNSYEYIHMLTLLFDELAGFSAEEIAPSLISL